MTDFQHIRLIEALLFASAEPVDERGLAERLPEGTDVGDVLATLQDTYAERGITLVSRGGKWAFRTAPDLAASLSVETNVGRKLSRAAVETLSIIAYHQPVTRAEIEEIRGVALSRGTLDVLFEAGWIRPRGRRRSPGKPMLWGITDTFLDHFGLVSLDDLPGIEELKAAGLLDSRPGLSSYANRAGEEADMIDVEQIEALDEEELERKAVDALRSIPLDDEAADD
ncbi:MAG TPA: SMC-Scp complex subunit ScpB [Patescibacteria group bacterium]|nr:SMC-Scp complex subunit ScpB [Patescibacteria group bacterium]